MILRVWVVWSHTLFKSRNICLTTFDKIKVLVSCVDVVVSLIGGTAMYSRHNLLRSHISWCLLITDLSDSTKLSFIVKLGVLFIPLRWVTVITPHHILESILNLVLVTYNNFLSAKRYSSFAAILIMIFNLNILISVKVKPIIYFIMPIIIVSIPRIDLIRPLEIHHLSLFLVAIRIGLVALEEIINIPWNFMWCCSNHLCYS
jgi:hypothetical protein